MLSSCVMCVMNRRLKNHRSAARFRGLAIVSDTDPGVPLRFTPGFMLSPASQADRILFANFRNIALASYCAYSVFGQFHIVRTTRNCASPLIIRA
jgi:hypothetical protein